MDTRDVTTSRRRGPIEWLRRRLGGRSMPLVVAVLGVVMTASSLGGGWMMDDHYHRGTMLGLPRFREFFGSPMALFRFFDGDPERAERMMDFGMVPWWTFTDMKAQFWRPLTVLTHWVDYQLWPERPVLMHAHSLLWYGGLVALVALLYRRIIGPGWVAGLAGVLYAVDDAHALPAGWLANRNAVLAALFGVGALLLHDRWRRDGWRAGAVLAPVALAAGLLSAEAGIATCAYLFAYAIVLDRGTLRRRCVTLIPYAAVVVVWRAVWKLLGYGVSDIGLYVDPLTEPWRFVTGALTRGPILLLGQCAAPPSELSAFLAPEGVRWMWLGAVIFLGLLLALMIPVLLRDRPTRFWALGMVLAVVPVCATFPADRLLCFVGIGAMGLLARFLAVAFGTVAWRPRSLAWRSGAVSLGVVFVLVHLVFAPAFLAVRAAYPMGAGGFGDTLCDLPPTDRPVEDQDVIIVNPPSPLHTGYLPVLRALRGQPVPRHTRALAPGVPSITVTRPDERTLVIRPKNGYLTWIFDRLFRNERHPMVLGQRVALTGLTIEVTALTEDGRPAEAAFRFAVPLEDPSLRWRQWKDRDFVPFTPPPVGDSIKLYAELPLP